MRKLNYGIGFVAILSQIIIAIYYHCGKISNINTILIVSAVITAIAFLVVNSWHNWFRGVLIALCSIIIMFGVGKFAIMCGYVGTYTIAQTNNLIQINNIQSEKNFTKIMSYDGDDYYVDNGYTYVYKITPNGLFSSIEAHSIMIDTDAEKVFKNMLGEFYEVNNNDYFSNIGNVRVSIALVKGTMDNSCFLKMITDTNKVFYSYLTLDNPSQLIQDMNIAQETINIGSIQLIITKPSKIIDGTVDANGNLEYVDGKQYIITSGTKTLLSDLTLISFDENNGYYNRINYYLYKDYFAEIDKYSEELKKLTPETDEYKEMEKYINNIKAMISSYTCDLCYELVQPERTVRLYRAFIKNEELATAPNMTIVEIEYDDYYLYALTDITLDELK